MNIDLFLSALGLSVLFHFGVQKVFIYYKKFDDFNHRSSHNTLATRTGGIGVFASLFLISSFYYLKGVELFKKRASASLIRLKSTQALILDFNVFPLLFLNLTSRKDKSDPTYSL